MAILTRLLRSGSEPEEPHDPGQMSLVEHLRELRRRVIISAVAVAVGGVLGFFLYDWVIDILKEPYTDITGRTSFIVFDPLEQFTTRFKVSAYVGLLVASPVVLWQLWRFITPGLYEKEKRYAVPFVLSSVLLFIGGSLLAFWTFPHTLEFFELIGGASLDANYTPGKYLGLLTTMMLVFGVGFEFPVVLTFLQIARVLSWQRLVQWRRYAIVSIFVIGAVITPSGDPVTLLALCLPICILYEVSILLGRFVISKK